MAENSRQKYLREEYIARMNKVLDYIETHYEKVLSLGEVAGVSGFSKYHFHRIFRAIVSEPLNQFVFRIRVKWDQVCL